MGSWASERELGTEEQVLTLPLSETDALVGKWLAVSTYFTVALLCSLSNVAVLMRPGWAGHRSDRFSVSWLVAIRTRV